MSIIQIAKIQHRTGNLTDLPQLSEGEFGFATDTRQLFIGNDQLLYPPTSTTSQTEVLTEHSVIRFSQVDGNGKDIFIDPNIPIESGQIISFNSTLDKWTIAGGTSTNTINLGDITNVKMLGGAGGYTVETDGTGNLSWGHKGYAVSSIANISNASPATVTTTSPHFFMNSVPLTITDIVGVVSPANATGTITSITTSDLIAGTGTSFDTTYVGKTLFNSANAVIGVVKTVITTTSLQLKNIASIAVTAGAFKTGNSPLNGITAYANVQNENQFTIYSDSTLTTPISTTAYTVGYQSAGRVIGNVLPNSTGTAASGTNYAVQFAFNGVLANSAQLTYSGTGLLSAPRFAGNGSALTSITGSNIVGTVANAAFSTNSNLAAFAGNVVNASQANITTVGNLTNLRVIGNAVIGNAISITTRGTTIDAGLQVTGITANKSSEVIGRFSNDTGEAKLWLGKSRGTVGTYTAVQAGDGLGSIVFAGADSTKAVDGAAIVSHSVTNAATNNVAANLSFWTNNNNSSLVQRMNIDQTGNIQMFGNLSVAGTIAGSIQLAQNVTASSQPNISSVGILTSLNVSGTSLLDDITFTGNLIGANIVSSTTITSPTFIAGTNAVSNGNVTFRSVAGNSFSIVNDGVLKILTAGNDISISNNGDVIGNSFSGLHSGNASGLFNIVAANIVGNVPFSTNSATAVVVTASNQPNITSVGVLTNLNVVGEIISGTNSIANTFIIRSGVDNVANIKFATGITTFNGIGNSIALGTDNTNRLVVDESGVITVPGTVNSTSKTTGTVVVGGGIGVGGNVVANAFYGLGSGLTSITGANVVGHVPLAGVANSAINAGTVTSNAQPNITSVGTLVSANVVGVVNAGSYTSNAAGYVIKNSSNVMIGETYFNGGDYKIEAIGANVGLGLATNGGVRLDISANGVSQFNNAVKVVDNTVSTNTTSGAVTISGGLGVVGNVYAGNVSGVNGSFTSISGNLVGNVSGTASFANQLTNNISINGVPFNGTSSITIPDGRYKIQSGRNEVLTFTGGGDNFNYNYFDLFPPLGYTMNHLAGFTASAAIVHYNGVVDWNDSTYCTYTRLNDRIRVWVFNTEQRHYGSANWLAIWSPVELVIDNNNNTLYTTEPYTAGPSGLAELGANFNGSVLRSESYYGDGFASIYFNRNGTLSTNVTGATIQNTVSGKVWSAVQNPTFGDSYWINVNTTSATGGGQGVVLNKPTGWARLNTNVGIHLTNGITASDTNLYGGNPASVHVFNVQIAKNVINVGGVLTGVNIVVDGSVTLNVR